MLKANTAYFAEKKMFNVENGKFYATSLINTKQNLVSFEQER